MHCQRHQIRLNEIPYSYLEWQPNNPNPILCLHGLGDQGLVWASLGDYLVTRSHSFRLIAPDLRGHGDSGKPPTGYAFQDYQTDIDALLDHLNLDTVDIVAHSWGAKLACRWLTANPNRVKRVVLTDPFFIGTIPAVFKLTFPLLYRALSFLKLSQSFSSYAEAEALAKTLPEFKGWSTYQQTLFAHTIEEKPDGTWSSKFSKTARNEVFAEVMSVPGLTAPLAMPCLLLKPDKGVNRSNWQIAPFRQYFFHLTLEAVAGNHWSFLVNAAEFNPRVAAFLQSIS